MKYVLFVCTHNAGRSQIAQAFFERYAPDDSRARGSVGGTSKRPWLAFGYTWIV
jgi:protein-tyrosine-phosphatase